MEHAENPGRSPATYPILSLGFWPRYWIHMRPYLLFISGIAALSGMALSSKPEISRVLLAFVPFFLSYGFGQALTDVFQTDTDAISSSYRPLVRGEISRASVFWVSMSGFALGAGVIVLLSPWVALLGAITVVGLLLYTPLKRTWWGGPPWNSWIVALIVVMGYLSAGGVWAEAPPGLKYAILSVFFAYANFVVAGYFKDVSADRATGYNTFPVRFGWFAAVLYSDLTALLGAVAAGLCIWPVVALGSSASLVGGAILLIGVAVNLRAQIALHATRDEHAVGGEIAAVVRSMLLYCAAIVVSYQPSWFPAMVAFHVLFELTLRFRPAQSQV
jgi:4-hydroxybenzoate polyprenyltransferase